MNEIQKQAHYCSIHNPRNYRTITIVSGTFTALKFMGKAIMLNPIGLMAAGIAAAVVGIGYLIDRFIGFDVILQAVGKAIGWVWDGIKSMINMLPDALIPDDWKTSLEAAGDELLMLFILIRCLSYIQYRFVFIACVSCSSFPSYKT